MRRLEIEDEINALAEFINPLMPDVYIENQDIPKVYKPKLISISFEKGGSQDETSAHYRLDRLYQIVYFGANPRECLSAMSKLEKKIINEKRTTVSTPIPTDPSIKAITATMRFGPFSFSKPIKSANDVYFSIGMLQAEIREFNARAEAIFDTPEIGGIIITDKPKLPSDENGNGGGVTPGEDEVVEKIYEVKCQPK